jgi:hypothetical protein
MAVSLVSKRFFGAYIRSGNRGKKPQKDDRSDDISGGMPDDASLHAARK